MTTTLESESMNSLLDECVYSTTAIKELIKNGQKALEYSIFKEKRRTMKQFIKNTQW